MWNRGIVCFIFLWVSCVDTFEINLPEHQEMPVLSAIMQANQEVKVFFASTAMLTDSTQGFVENQQIQIRNEDTGEIETLVEVGQGWYVSTMVAQPLTTYKISTVFHGREVWGRDQIPKKGNLIEWDYNFISTGSQSGDDFHNVTIVLGRDSEIAEFYEFSFLSQSCLRNDPNQCFIDYFLFGDNVDPKIKAEGILEFDPSYYVLSDRLFQESRTSIFMQLLNGQTRGANGVQKVKDIPEGNLLNINYGSESYYLFKKNLLQYRSSINTDEQLNNFQKFFFGTDPKTLYSNVTNGLGVVVGVNKEYVHVFD